MSSEEPVVLPPANVGGPSGKNKMSLSVDLRWIIVLLLVVIGVMVALWRPWQSKPGTDSRTVSVTGAATVKATPDEFTFNPSYDFKNADKDAALKALTAKSAEVISALKKLGVPSDKIKTDSSGYQQGAYYYNYDATTKGYTYTLGLTITLTDEKLVQKVQDYLVSTSPTGSVSPYATFSDAKRKELESQARDEATKEARAKADQSAKNLGFKVGAVKNIDDSGFGGGVMPYAANSTMGMAEDTKSAGPSLAVQPGENNLNYSVTVVYYIR